jgi:D-serine deaminase-like pyridoxal phosphate-dependent protein
LCTQQSGLLFTSTFASPDPDQLAPTNKEGGGTIVATVNDLETPALLVDLDSMEGNLLRMATLLRHTSLKLRPHFKGHQVIAFASRQIQAGAIGITCARLQHAEALTCHGIKNILIANEITGDKMIQRFVELSVHNSVIVAIDNATVVSEMARVAGNRRDQLNVVVDVDVGLGRCGVPPGEAVLSLAKTVVGTGLRFRGLMAHRGNLRLPYGHEKHRLVCSAMRALIDSRNLIECAGIPVEIVSSGGTSDWSIVQEFPGVTEIQAGSYLLMDSWYLPFAEAFRPCLALLATVISKSPTRIVVDAGVKAISAQRGLPSIKGIAGLEVKALHAEHTIIDILDSEVRIEVGNKIEMWVSHSDATLSLHSQMYGVRRGEVEEVFHIER